MAARRLSNLQCHILTFLWTQYVRTRGGISTGHWELVQALGRDKSNVSHSLRTLEARGLITIGRSPGSYATHLDLTAEGRKVAANLIKSCD
jgi:DNA-binding MarR family transcriptional regulator